MAMGQGMLAKVRS